MVKYLQMDGVDDVLRTAVIAFDRVVIDFSFEPNQTSTTAYYLYDNRGGSPAGNYMVYINNTSNVANKGTGISSSSLDGQTLATGTRYVSDSSYGSAVLPNANGMEVFVNYINQNSTRTKGNLYDVKLYNGTTLVAHYDMSTGTVLDQSGNGNHATLTGGTWLDDGTGGTTDPGTDGTTAFDSHVVFYSDASTHTDTKQIAYADGTLANDIRHLLYADQSQATDTRIAIYQDGATTQDTAQALYEMSVVAFDTLQELFNDGQVGATPFDIRVQLYGDASAQYDTKQSVYDVGLLRYDVAQVIYESNTMVADVKAVIYADSAIKADAVQSFYTDGTFNADTLQRILAEFSEYGEVLRIVLEITQRRRESLAITQQFGSDLEIVQRRVIELNL